MSRPVRSRALVVFLLLVLLALPVLAREQTKAPAPAPSLLTALWQALTELVPGLAKPGGGLPPGGAATGSQGDLGAGLDPLE
jgi:hypothetical protein